MPAATQTPYGRNPKRPAEKKIGLCGVCGEEVIAATLIPQRGTLVSYQHRGCLDRLDTYNGPRPRGPHYGGS